MGLPAPSRAIDRLGGQLRRWIDGPAVAVAQADYRSGRDRREGSSRGRWPVKPGLPMIRGDRTVPRFPAAYPPTAGDISLPQDPPSAAPARPARTFDQLRRLSEIADVLRKDGAR